MVKDEIRDFINQGLYIELVPETIKLGTWEGTAYIAIDMKDGSASYMISGGNAGGSSMEFEDLFLLNNFLFVTNWQIGTMTLITSYKDLLCGQIDCNPLGAAKGVQGLIGSAITLSGALNIRYSNYDYIFKIAEAEDENKVMLEYKIFTLRNMFDTVINVATAVMGLCGDIGGVVSAGVRIIYDTVMTVLDSALAGDDFSFMDAFTLIWDYMGLWIAQLARG